LLLLHLQDGNTSSFSQTELNNILAIWRGVAEDYHVWDVDVTTEDPGDAYLANWSVRAVIGGSSNDWYAASAGGVAYVGVFPTASTNYGLYYQPAFIFPAQLGGGYPKYVWEVRRRGGGGGGACLLNADSCEPP
jgi:hypothetical protein